MQILINRNFKKHIYFVELSIVWKKLLLSQEPIQKSTAGAIILISNLQLPVPVLFYSLYSSKKFAYASHSVSKSLFRCQNSKLFTSYILNENGIKFFYSIHVLKVALKKDKRFVLRKDIEIRRERLSEAIFVQKKFKRRSKFKLHFTWKGKKDISHHFNLGLDRYVFDI